MILKYLQLALRVMNKYRGYTFINIVGLTVGVTCSLLIGLYASDEWMFDTFHPHSDRLYRATLEIDDGKTRIKTALSPAPLVDAVEDGHHAEEATRFVAWKTFPIRYLNKSFTEDYLLLADPNFFSFFNHALLAGDPATALQGQGKLVITRSAAARYFDYKDGADSLVLGKILTLAQGYQAIVSGIAEDPPFQSHFHFTHVLSLASWPEGMASAWTVPRVYTYMRIAPGKTPLEVEKKLDSLLQLQQQRVFRADTAVVEQRSNQKLTLQPVTTIHLYSSLEDEIEKNGNIRNVYISVVIAAFIALLACINFINLATARSANRSKEVAIRKTVGASSQSLLRQFLLESYFYIFISLVLSYVLIAFSLPFFNYYTGKSISYLRLLDPKILISLLLLGAGIGLIAGLYPSIYLARYNPIEVLRGQLRSQMRRFGVRNVLVVFQFFIASAMIISTLTMYSQLRYVHNLNPGFVKENIFNLLHTKNLLGHGEVFKKELKALPGVVNASYTNRLPPNVTWEARFVVDSSQRELHMFVYEMDYDHPATLDIVMLEGRFFSPQYPEDSLAIIINETAYHNLGWVDIENKKLFSHYDLPDGKLRKVIGVIRDFNFQSAKKPIQPLAVIMGKVPNWEMAIRTKTQRPDSLAMAIQKLWNRYTEGAPFELRQLEKNIRSSYDAERNTGTLILVFTMLAIVIACLGLHGLATFTTQKRNKEIGIRKVMGANITSVTYLLNRQFLFLVFIGNIAAWPVAWWMLSQWLSQFEYRIELTLLYFVGATAISVAVAVLSVSYQALRAASENPVNALRAD